MTGSNQTPPPAQTEEQELPYICDECTHGYAGTCCCSAPPAQPVDDAAEFQCLVPFPDQSDSFVNGFEAGMVWQRMINGERLIGGNEEIAMHSANADVFRRMASAHGYDVTVERCDQEWAIFTFTKWPKRFKIVEGSQS
ncbi:hypothetical protein [Rhizobium azibense]|uniref:Uncharacterized protein n=1 Tax=Rhizobium azibense TaxID=1136135 RepID=A0A4R3RI25_9HYPH|nr:hypothetical protein [Rhizobium azibense]TCU34029.1 hypothetical protein EV129_11312 [Rhizobium azibense]